jgi:lipocalin-like protein
MRRKIGVITALLVVAASLLARAQTAPSLQGAWRVTESVVTGANAETNTNPQPGLFLFTKQHYSIVTVNGTAPRKNFDTARDPAKLTDAEKIARYEVWDKFSANSGTYKVSGSTLTTHPLVAKNPAVMGPEITREFKIEGNTLTLVRKSPAGQPASVTTTRLTRVE